MLFCCGFVGLLWLAGLVACFWHMRRSAWLALVVLGWFGVAFGAALETLAHVSPEGEVDPYKYPELLAQLKAAWAAYWRSGLAIVAGLVMTWIHIRRKEKARRRAAEAPVPPDAESLHLWGERRQEPNRGVQPGADPPSDITP